MKTYILVILTSALMGLNPVYGQKADKSISKPQKTSFAGIHVGVVQPLLATNNGNTNTIADDNFFAIGFPIGITFKTPGRLLFDMEFVPFINPGTEIVPLNTHLLLHPGVLLPLGKGFTLGLRAAFELGQGQAGFTPLINKAFKLKNNNVFFTELVLPGRFGPLTNSGYTQVVALHLGVGF